MTISHIHHTPHTLRILLVNTTIGAELYLKDTVVTTGPGAHHNTNTSASHLKVPEEKRAEIAGSTAIRMPKQVSEASKLARIDMITQEISIKSILVIAYDIYHKGQLQSQHRHVHYSHQLLASHKIRRLWLTQR